MSVTSSPTRVGHDQEAFMANGIPVNDGKRHAPVKEGWIYEDEGRLIGGPAGKIIARYIIMVSRQTRPKVGGTC